MQTIHSRVTRLAGMLDELDVGLVSLDAQSEFAHVNRTAAVLLNIPEGTTTAAQAEAFIAGVAGRAVNQTEVFAATRLLSDDPTAEIKTTWVFDESPTHLGVVCKPSPYPGFEGRIWAFYDNSAIAQAIDNARRANALIRASSDAMIDPQVLLEGVWRDGDVVDLVYRDVNRATCEYLGMSREELLGHSLLDSLPNIDGSGLLAHYTNCAQTGEPVILDAFPYYNEVLDDSRYYDVRANQVTPGWMSLTWRDVTERFHFDQRVAASEQQFRLLAENVADVVVRLGDDGRITWISNSVEGALGAPAEHWIGRRAIEFAVPEELVEARSRVAKIMNGGADLGRARVIDARGVAHWIHLHSKPFFDADGRRDGIVASFRVIDGEVAAEVRSQEQLDKRDAQNRSLTKRLQAQKDRLTAELSSAARYVASILPGELDGAVHITSRYVPSRMLGGDCYDYRWIDDDHLIVYLIDVSGHGIEAAMVSVSIHNLLRSGSIPAATLLEPSAVLTELNRLFQMDQHGGNYFTAWYGVYQPSTRTLRYACAGHPPALAFTGSTTVQLSAEGLPIGAFEDNTFTTETFRVAPGTELLLYSDGAYELTLNDGTWWSLGEFVELWTRMATRPSWSLDEILAMLHNVPASGLFDDDCTLVRLTID